MSDETESQATPSPAGHPSYRPDLGFDLTASRTLTPLKCAGDLGLHDNALLSFAASGMNFAHGAFAAPAPVDTNAPPILAIPLADRDAVKNEAVFFQLPQGSFTDPDSTLKYTATLANGDALPAWLTFNVHALTFSGTPPADFTGHLDIIVTASDHHHDARDTFGIATASDRHHDARDTFRLDIRNHDAAPVAARVHDQTIAEDTPWSYHIHTGTFTDADSSDLTYTALMADRTALPSWLHFDPVTQTFTGTPPANFNGTLDLAVTASDGSRSATADLTLHITPVPDAPEQMLGVQDRYVTEDTPFAFAVPNGAFVDPDGDALTYSATLANGDPLPSWLIFDPATQALSGTPPKNFNGSVDVRVTASDGTLSNSGDFTMHVTPTNDSPIVMHPIADNHITAGDPFTYKFSNHTFKDVDGPSLTYTVTQADGSDLPHWLHFNAATRTFSGTAPTDFAGPVAVVVTASDGSASARAAFTFSDTAPFLQKAIIDQTVGEMPNWSFTVPADAFHDFDSTDLTYSAKLANGDALPDWLHFDAASRTFTGTPPEDWAGHEDITVTASDGVHKAKDTFALDHKGDFTYHLTGSAWGQSAPDDIHFRYDDLYFESSNSFNAGFSYNFGSGVYGGISGHAGFSYAVQAGLLIDFDLKPDQYDLTESFDIDKTFSDPSLIGNPTLDIKGEIEDNSSFTMTTPDDAFLLHAFAGITAQASASFGGSIYAGVDGLGSVGVGFDETVNFPSIPKILIEDGKFTKPDGDVGAIDVTIKTGDPMFDIELDSSGIGHIKIGPPSISTSGYQIGGDTGNGLGTLTGGGVSSPILSAVLDLDKLAIKAVPELSALFHDTLSFDLGAASFNASLDSDFALVGDLSLGEAVSLTPQIHFSMTTSFGQTITGNAGDHVEYNVPEGEGHFTVDATYTTDALLQTAIGLVSTVHFDMTLLKAVFGGSIGIPHLFSFDFFGINAPPAYAGSFGLFDVFIPFYTETHTITTDQVRNETYTLPYEKFRTVDGSGNVFTLTTHQVTASLSNDADTVTGNALDNTIFGKGGDDTLFGVAGNDTLSGSLGNDHLYGGTGFNTLEGSFGDDVLQSGNNGSHIDGGDGNDTIKTGTGDDTIVDLLGLVNIKDAGGNNDVTVGDQGVTLKMLNGNNTIHAGAGNDHITTGAGNDHIFGGDGVNTINVGGGDNSINGGAMADHLTGGSGADNFDGMAGNDVMNAGDGNNVLFGGDGSNTITCGSGDDQIFLSGAGGNTVHAGDGNNSINGGQASGGDTIVTGSGNDSIVVGGGANVITAGGGNDFILTLGGKDTITAGAGADTIVGGTNADVFIYNAVSDSNGAAYDRLSDFNVNQDKLDLTVAVTGIDAAQTGALNTATFNPDLKAILTPAHLAAGHAVVVTATGGLSGALFLVVDANGMAGYQPGQDYVMQLDMSVGTNFHLSDFI